MHYIGSRQPTNFLIKYVFCPFFLDSFRLSKDRSATRMADALNKKKNNPFHNFYLGKNKAGGRSSNTKPVGIIHNTHTEEKLNYTFFVESSDFFNCWY